MFIIDPYRFVAANVDRDGILDTYTGAESAIGLFRMRKGYQGPLIRVRRASDNTEQDIGYVESTGALDETALTTFCSGTDGFVTVAFDQVTGAAVHYVQTTVANQPKIVTSGVVEKDGSSRPIMRFDGTDTLAGNAPKALDASPFSVFMRGRMTTTGNASVFINNSSSQALQNNRLLNNGVAITYGTSAVTGDCTLSCVADGATLTQVWQNGTALNPTTNWTTNRTSIVNTSLTISNGASFDTSAMIYYPSNQNTNRSGIESALNSFTGAITNTTGTYVGYNTFSTSNYWQSNTAPAPTPFSGGATMTAFVLFRLDSVPTGNEYIFSSTNATSRGWTIRITSSFAAQTWIHDGGGTQRVVSAGRVMRSNDTGRVHSIAMTYSGGALRLYLNGKEVGTPLTGLTGFTAESANRFLIGAGGAGVSASPLTAGTVIGGYVSNDTAATEAQIAAYD